MAIGLTNFARLTDHDKKMWSMSFWKNARNRSFLTRVLGTSSDSVVQRITELKKSVKGTQAVITLIPDTVGDGVAGDRTLKGSEEAISSAEEVIRVDQLRNAHKSEGRMADQKTIVNFRKEARDQLGQWAGDRIDQIAFLTMAGESYTQYNNGVTRTGSDLPYLEFASDVVAPSTNRYFNWDGDTNGLAAGATNADTLMKPTYEMLLHIKAKMQDEYIKPNRGEMGTELYHIFMTPQAIKHLKLDDKFHNAVRDAMPRSPKNKLFTGFDTIYIDGMAVHTHRSVFNNSGLETGSWWGASSDIEGCAVIACGAQALAYADLGSPFWVEEDDDYENQIGISVGKIFGFLKPQFESVRTATTEDFGLMRINVGYTDSH